MLLMIFPFRALSMEVCVLFQILNSLDFDEFFFTQPFFSWYVVHCFDGIVYFLSPMWILMRHSVDWCVCCVVVLSYHIDASFWISGLLVLAVLDFIEWFSPGAGCLLVERFGSHLGVEKFLWP